MLDPLMRLGMIFVCDEARGRRGIAGIGVRMATAMKHGVGGAVSMRPGSGFTADHKSCSSPCTALGLHLPTSGNHYRFALSDLPVTVAVRS